MYLSKYIRSNLDPSCFIKYQCNIDNFNDYWCYDFSPVFRNYQFVVIEEMQVPVSSDRLFIAEDLIKLFCDIMTTENRVIVVNLDDLELINNIYRYNYDEDLLTNLIDLLDIIGFTPFCHLNDDFDNTVYFYTKSKLGNAILSELEYFYESNMSLQEG